MARALPASLLASAALLLVPGAALAQNAGTGQYKDPLAGPGGGTTHSTPSTSTPSTSSNATPGATASAAGATASDSSTATAGGEATAGGSQIPRTGFPVGLLMFAGALLLWGGVGLRRAAESSAR
jgi:hypothetical protein